MGKNRYIDREWMGKPIYRYVLKSSESQYVYRFVSTKIEIAEAIEMMRSYIDKRTAYRLFCNGVLVHNYSARKNPVIRNKKTGDIWKNIVEFCLDHGYDRKKAQEVIRRKKDIYEYIHCYS